MPLFVGEFEQSIDDKRRLAISAALREGMAEEIVRDYEGKEVEPQVTDPLLRRAHELLHRHHCDEAHARQVSGERSDQDQSQWMTLRDVVKIV